jgi:hypothetical protein
MNELIDLLIDSNILAILMVQQGVIFGIEGFTAMGFGPNKKTPAPWDPLTETGTESPISTNITSLTNIITVVSCLPLWQHGFNRLTQFDAGTLFERGRMRLL